MMKSFSPFALLGAKALDLAKFQDALITAKGEVRASVALTGLDTLWFNTGTLCNLACKNCYIESSPTNDALVYLTLAEVTAHLDEIAANALSVRQIGFTGGEPFMNKDMVAMLELCLSRGFEVLVLTNAMRPMLRFKEQIVRLPFQDRLTFRVSLDHYSPAVHNAERGPKSWDKAIAGLKWIASHGFNLAVAGRHLGEESNDDARRGYRTLFAQHGLPIDAGNPGQLLLFPEMDANADVPEITTACWDVLHVDPASVMCASSRMVVKRKGEATPRVVACTLLPYDPQFDMGATLKEASKPVILNHPHCARFCVLGGASCSA
jgi:uncharacterized Fe-S cluster-containing radical SAM superfamily protein